MYALLILLPIIFLRRMSFIGYFSIFVLIATFIAIGLIIYLTSVIISKSPAEVRDEYHTEIKDEDRDYNYFDWMMFPVFLCGTMGLFEGNQMILNLYADADKPQNFFMQVSFTIIGLTLCIAAVVGYLGYLAFGATSKSVILYNLPNDDPIAITVKCLYIITISGSFVLIVQPIF